MHDNNGWEEEDYDDVLSPPEYDICIDCERTELMMDECSCCGAAMCSACYEMGAGVCKGPHK